MKHVKKPTIRLSSEDVKPTKQDALELFHSGIKADETRRTMDGNLKRFLVDACAEILQGDYKQRAQEFVDIAKEDQDRAVGIVMAYTRKLREQACLEKMI